MNDYSHLSRFGHFNPDDSYTITALPQIIDWYAARGYRFVNILGES